MRLGMSPRLACAVLALVSRPLSGCCHTSASQLRGRGGAPSNRARAVQPLRHATAGASSGSDHWHAGAAATAGGSLAAGSGLRVRTSAGDVLGEALPGGALGRKAWHWPDAGHRSGLEHMGAGMPQCALLWQR